MPIKISLSLPVKPTFMITAGGKRERELAYYNNEFGMVVNSKRAITLKRLAAVGVIGLVSCGILSYLTLIAQ